MNILSLAYLGNIQYFSKLCFSDCVIDIHEHYVKQSYRNRCDILSASGPISLIVNTSKPTDGSRSVKDIRVDYSKRWQHQHRQALISAYRNTPFFDHYWPEFEPFYSERSIFLADLNRGLMEAALRLLDCGREVVFSNRYIEPEAAAQRGYRDLRDAISPKPRLAKPDPGFRAHPYWQLFSDKMPFAENLSVIDLLFCEGPAAMDILRLSLTEK